jgi:hypothetical protein
MGQWTPLTNQKTLQELNLIGDEYKDYTFYTANNHVYEQFLLIALLLDKVQNRLIFRFATVYDELGDEKFNPLTGSGSVALNKEQSFELIDIIRDKAQSLKQENKEETRFKLLEKSEYSAYKIEPVYGLRLMETPIYLLQEKSAPDTTIILYISHAEKPQNRAYIRTVHIPKRNEQRFSYYRNHSPGLLYLRTQTSQDFCKILEAAYSV